MNIGTNFFDKIISKNKEFKAILCGSEPNIVSLTDNTLESLYSKLNEVEGKFKIYKFIKNEQTYKLIDVRTFSSKTLDEIMSANNNLYENIS